MKFKKIDYTAGMNLILNKTGFVRGTRFLGHISISPKKLKKVFGKANPSDGYKISGEYAFISEDEKTLYTIYDWKMTTLYDKDESYTKPKKFWKLEKEQSFNIGGNNKSSFFHFKSFIKRKIRYNSFKEKS